MAIIYDTHDFFIPINHISSFLSGAISKPMVCVLRIFGPKLN